MYDCNQSSSLALYVCWLFIYSVHGRKCSLPLCLILTPSLVQFTRRPSKKFSMYALYTWNNLLFQEIVAIKSQTTENTIKFSCMQHITIKQCQRKKTRYIAHPKIEHCRVQWAKKTNVEREREKKKISSTTIPNLPIAKDNSVQFNIHRFDSIHTLQSNQKRETENERVRESTLSAQCTHTRTHVRFDCVANNQ